MKNKTKGVLWLVLSCFLLSVLSFLVGGEDGLRVFMFFILALAIAGSISKGIICFME